MGHGKPDVRWKKDGETREMSEALDAHAHPVSCMSDESHWSVRV